MSAAVTISERHIRDTGGVVVLPVAEYRKLIEASVPTHYLTGKEAEDADRLVEEGLREYHEGKTITASSIGEALKIHGRRTKTHRAR